MSVLIESMTRISLPRYTVRVWRQQPEDFTYSPGQFSDIESVARANEYDAPSELAKKIAALPNVNAVEVLDWDKGGVVVYNNWP